MILKIKIQKKKFNNFEIFVIQEKRNIYIF
jgi:hypothetical protein